MTTARRNLVNISTRDAYDQLISLPLLIPLPPRNLDEFVRRFPHLLDFEKATIKRPSNNFMLFRAIMAHRLSRITFQTDQQSGHLPQPVVSGVLRTYWSQLENKALWKASADIIVEEHKKKYPDYVFKPVKKGKKGNVCGEPKIPKKAQTTVRPKTRKTKSIPPQKTLVYAPSHTMLHDIGSLSTVPLPGLQSRTLEPASPPVVGSVVRYNQNFLSLPLAEQEIDLPLEMAPPFMSATYDMTRLPVVPEILQCDFQAEAMISMGRLWMGDHHAQSEGEYVATSEPLNEGNIMSNPGFPIPEHLRYVPHPSWNSPASAVEWGVAQNAAQPTQHEAPNAYTSYLPRPPVAFEQNYFSAGVNNSQLQGGYNGSNMNLFPVHQTHRAELWDSVSNQNYHYDFNSYNGEGSNITNQSDTQDTLDETSLSGARLAYEDWPSGTYA